MFDDIEQLNNKINQIQEQYHIVSKNVAVTLFYLKDTKEQFSSFERFRLYDQSKTSPVESVVLKYDFLIKLPKTQRLQNYSLTIRLASKIAVYKRIRDEDDIFFMSSVFTGRTIQVTINYVDYMVARNFQDAVRAWVDALEEHSHPKILKFIQKKSHWIPRLLPYVLLGFLLVAIVQQVETFLPPETAKFSIFAVFILLSFSALFTIFNMMRQLGRMIENAIDEYTEISYIRLNRGDDKEIKNAETRNRNQIYKGAASAVGSLVFKLGSGYVVSGLSFLQHLLTK